MQILYLPLLIILLPNILLILMLKYWKKEKQYSLGLKITLGIVFIILGIVSMYIAIIVSMHGHKEIQCASGVIIFIPISVLLNLIGIPLLLVLEKKIRKIQQ